MLTYTDPILILFYFPLLTVLSVDPQSIVASLVAMFYPAKKNSLLINKPQKMREIVFWHGILMNQSMPTQAVYNKFI